MVSSSFSTDFCLLSLIADTTADIGNFLATSLMDSCSGHASSVTAEFEVTDGPSVDLCALGSLRYRSNFEDVATGCFGPGGS